MFEIGIQLGANGILVFSQLEGMVYSDLLLSPICTSYANTAYTAL